jgi:hypothetical protein
LKQSSKTSYAWRRAASRTTATPPPRLVILREVMHHLHVKQIRLA